MIMVRGKKAYIRMQKGKEAGAEAEKRNMVVR